MFCLSQLSSVQLVISASFSDWNIILTRFGSSFQHCLLTERGCCKQVTWVHLSLASQNSIQNHPASSKGPFGWLLKFIFCPLLRYCCDWVCASAVLSGMIHRPKWCLSTQCFIPFPFQRENNGKKSYYIWKIIASLLLFGSVVFFFFLFLILKFDLTKER